MLGDIHINPNGVAADRMMFIKLLGYVVFAGWWWWCAVVLVIAYQDCIVWLLNRRKQNLHLPLQFGIRSTNGGAGAMVEVVFEDAITAETTRSERQHHATQ